MCRRTIVAIACWVLADAVCGMEGWAPKFYNGHEGEGEVRLVADGYMGKEPALLIRHVSGQMKFGAEKKVSTALKGVVEWKVEADIRCGKEGIADVAMEFFGTKDRSLGVLSRRRMPSRRRSICCRFPRGLCFLPVSTYYRLPARRLTNCRWTSRHCRRNGTGTGMVDKSGA